MNADVLDYLICPECSGTLAMQVFSRTSDDVEEGILTCDQCGVWYRIEGGIASLLPQRLQRAETIEAFADRHGLKVPGRSSKQGDGESAKVVQREYFDTRSEYYESVEEYNFFLALQHLTFEEWHLRMIHPGDLVLDIGCGAARQAVSLAKRGIRCIGVDISEELLRLGKKKLDNIGCGRFADLIVGDAECPPVKNGAFTACVCYGTLHHLGDPARTIQAASLKLKAGGHWFSLDPHKSPVRPVFNALMRLWKLYGQEHPHDSEFSEAQIHGWLDRAGLAGITKVTVYIPPHVLCLMNDRYVPRIIQLSDRVFSFLGLTKLGGVIVAEASKKA